MINTNKTLELLKYINAKMSKESIQLLCSTNNIKLEKCELYNDYVQSLSILIFETFLGDDITDDVQKINHFRWCWHKNLDNFMREGIRIGDARLYNYFLEFMQENYYSVTPKSNPILEENILKLWSYIFDFTDTSNDKSKSDMDTFIEIYKLFDVTLKVE